MNVDLVAEANVDALFEEDLPAMGTATEVICSIASSSTATTSEADTEAR
jgi:hypothetical protein